MFPYFTVFGKTFGLYAICSVIGVAICCIFATRCLKKIGLEFEDVILFVLVIMAGLMIGGHFLYGVTQYKLFFGLIGKVGSINDLFDLLKYTFGGNVFYGGFIGMNISLYIYFRAKKFESADFIKDVVAACVPLFHAFGRIGCFLGGCCYGKPSHFGFIVTGNTFSPDINGVRRFPVQLLEALLNIIIFIILYFLLKKMFMKGHLMIAYMLIYPPVRFMLEYIRGDAIRGFWGPLSTSQWISIALFLAAIIRIIILKKQKQKSLS